MQHILKIEPKYANRIVTGEKRFEVRVNDRDYQTGDVITLIPTYKSGETVTIRGINATITYVHSVFGMKENYVILGIDNITYTYDAENYKKLKEVLIKAKEYIEENNVTYKPKEFGDNLDKILR